MNHPNESTLRTYLDGELSEERSNTVKNHLQTCHRCWERLEALHATSQMVSYHLNSMLLKSPQQPISNTRGLKRFYAKENTMKSTSNARKLRPVWVGIAVMAVIVVAFTFQPIRAIASDFLSLFRVQKVSTIQIDSAYLDQFTSDKTLIETFGQVFSDSVTITREQEDAQEGLDSETAKEAAGFPVRLPKDMTAVDISIESGLAFDIHVSADKVNEVLAAAGREDLQFPESLKEADISVDMANIVTSVYGECVKMTSNDPDEGTRYRNTDKCLLLVQSLNPTIQSESDIDFTEAAKFGFQFLGMSVDEASGLSQSIDWKTTLVIPIPTGEADSTDIEIDGVQGTLIQGIEDSQEFILVWLKNDVIYTIYGYGDPTEAINLANSLE